MPLTLDGTNGVSAVQAGSIQSDDLAAGVGGKVLQVVQGTTTTSTNNASTSYADTTLTASITPSSTSSKVLVLISQSYRMDERSDDKVRVELRLLRGSTTIGTDPIAESQHQSGAQLQIHNGMKNIQYLDSPNTTNLTAYKVQGRSGFATIQNLFFQPISLNSTITLMEISG